MKKLGGEQTQILMQTLVRIAVEVLRREGSLVVLTPREAARVTIMMKGSRQSERDHKSPTTVKSQSEAQD